MGIKDGRERSIRARLEVCRIEQADARARFEAEVLAHLDAAYRFARWLCRDPADAEDVVHDAVVRAWRAWDGARAALKELWERSPYGVSHGLP